jgi:hypothetical protein
VAGAVYFQSSFGGIDLRITSIRTDGGRDIATRSPARGNRHWLQDRGQRFGRSDCELMFCDEAGKPDYLTRYAQFRDLVKLGVVSAFTHPLDGTYLARAGEMQVTGEASGCVTVQVAFLPEDEPDPTAPQGAGVAPIAGVEAVEAAGAEATAAVQASALPQASKDNLGTVIASVVSTIQTLESTAGRIASTVTAEIGNITGDIADAVELYDLAGDVKQWTAYRAVMALSYQAQRAAEMLIDDEPGTIQVQVAKTAPLLAILAEVYGATLALQMVDPVRNKNRIANPGRVPAGSVLECPGAGAFA